MIEILDFGKLESINPDDFKKLGELSVLQNYLQVVIKFMKESKVINKMKYSELIHKIETKILAARVLSQDRVISSENGIPNKQYLVFESKWERNRNQSQLSNVWSVYSS